MTLKANDIVNDSNIQTLVDYINSMMDNNSVNIYHLDGKTYIILDNGSGIEVTNKTTVSDVMYTFSNYYTKEADPNKLINGINDKKTQNQNTNYNSSNRYLSQNSSASDFTLDIDVDIYKEILDINEEIIQTLSDAVVPSINYSEETQDLSRYYTSINSNNLNQMKELYIIFLQDLKEKIKTCLDIYEQQDEMMLLFYNDIVSTIFTYGYEVKARDSSNNNDGFLELLKSIFNQNNVHNENNSNKQNSFNFTIESSDELFEAFSDNRSLTIEERQKNLSNFIIELENKYGSLKAQYNALYGNGVKISRENINAMLDLLGALGMFSEGFDSFDNAHLTDANLFSTNKVDGVTYQSSSNGFAISGDYQYLESEQWLKITQYCEKYGVMKALNNYVYGGKDWYESGLNDLFGNSLVNWWDNTSSSSGGFRSTDYNEELGNFDPNSSNIDPETVFLYRYLSATTFTSNTSTSSGTSYNYKDYGMNIPAYSLEHAEFADFAAFCYIVDQIEEEPIPGWTDTVLPYMYYYTGNLPLDYWDNNSAYRYYTCNTIKLTDAEKYEYVRYGGNDNHAIYETQAYRDYGLKGLDDIRICGFRTVSDDEGNPINLDSFAKGWLAADGRACFHNAILRYDDNDDPNRQVPLQYYPSIPEYIGNSNNYTYSRIFDFNNYSYSDGYYIHGVDNFGGLNCFYIKDKELAVNTVKKYIASKNIVSTYQEAFYDSAKKETLEAQMKELEKAINKGEYYQVNLKTIDIQYKDDYNPHGLPSDYQENLDKYLYYTDEELATLAWLEGHPEYDIKAKNYRNNIDKTLNEREGYTKAIHELQTLNNNFSDDINGSDYMWDILLSLGYTADKGFIDGVEGFFNGLVNLFSADGEKTVDDYEKMYFLKLLMSNNQYSQYIPEACRSIFADNYQLFSAVGDMLVPYVMTAGLGVADIFANIPANLAKGVQQTSALLYMSSHWGNAKEWAMQEGYDINQAFWYGFLSSTVDTISEYGLGLLSNSSGATTAAEWVMNMMQEGAEEYIQSYLGAGVQYAVLGIPIDFNELTEEARKDAIMGFLVAGVISTPQFVLNVGMDGKYVQELESEEQVAELERRLKELDPNQVYIQFYPNGRLKSIDYNKLGLTTPDYYSLVSDSPLFDYSRADIEKSQNNLMLNGFKIVDLVNTQYGTLVNCLNDDLGININCVLVKDNMVTAYDTNNKIYTFNFDTKDNFISQLEKIERRYGLKNSSSTNSSNNLVNELIIKARNIKDPNNARIALLKIEDYIKNNSIPSQYKYELQEIASTLGRMVTNDIYNNPIKSNNYKDINIVLCGYNNDIKKVIDNRFKNVYRALKLLPDYMQSILKGSTIWICTENSPFNQYWQLKYNNYSHKAAASADSYNGSITIWGNCSLYSPKYIESELLTHEVGHIIDLKMFDALSDKLSWTSARRVDNYIITEYGEENNHENFAEAIRFYSNKLLNLKLKRNSPERYKILQCIEKTLSNPDSLSIDEKLEIIKITGSPVIANKLIGINNCPPTLILESILYREKSSHNRELLQNLIDNIKTICNNDPNIIYDFHRYSLNNESVKQFLERMNNDYLLIYQLYLNEYKRNNSNSIL